MNEITPGYHNQQGKVEGATMDLANLILFLHSRLVDGATEVKANTHWYLEFDLDDDRVINLKDGQAEIKTSYYEALIENLRRSHKMGP